MLRSLLLRLTSRAAGRTLVAIAIVGASFQDYFDTASVRAAEPLPMAGAAMETAAPRGGPNLNPQNVEGQALCADCHRAEVLYLREQWRDSEHGWVGYTRLLGDRAKSLADDLGIDSDQVTKNSVCIECHATPSLDFHGRMKPILGVDCEACHNPAGGEQGWLNLHAVYGPPGTQRIDETPEHRQQRKQRTQEAGQLQSANIYSLVRRCYNCHIIGDEELITKTDHQYEDRDFSDIADMITSAKLRHNFHLNQQENAEVATLWLDPHWYPELAADVDQSIENRKRMYRVVAPLARAEVILRLLAKVQDPAGQYAGDIAGLLDVGDLEDLLTSYPWNDEDMKTAEELIESLEDMEIEDLAGDVDEDGTLSDEEVNNLVAAADQIAIFGKQIARGNGDDLDDVELP